MTEKEFEQLYGRKPYKKRVRYKIYWGRIFIALLILVLIIYLIVKAVSGLISIIKKTGGDDSSSMAAAVSQSQSAQADSGEKSKTEKQEEEALRDNDLELFRKLKKEAAKTGDKLSRVVSRHLHLD